LGRNTTTLTVDDSSLCTCEHVFPHARARCVCEHAGRDSSLVVAIVVSLVLVYFILLVIIIARRAYQRRMQVWRFR
jgi:hypothetical protein